MQYLHSTGYFNKKGIMNNGPPTQDYISSVKYLSIDNESFFLITYDNNVIIIWYKN